MGKRERYGLAPRVVEKQLEKINKELGLLIDKAPSKFDLGGWRAESAREHVLITLNTVRRLWKNTI